MTAHHDDAAGTGAFVRKPPGKGDGASDAARYGDLAVADRPDEVGGGGEGCDVRDPDRDWRVAKCIQGLRRCREANLATASAPARAGSLNGPSRHLTAVQNLVAFRA